MSSSANGQAEAAAKEAQKSVLVIDDEKALLDSVRKLLSKNGYRVLTALDGLEGLEIALEQKPDLVLCDVLLPKMDGFEILKTLRGNPHMETLPFIFISGRSEMEDFRKGMDEGADDYLVKPFSPEDLVRAVDSRLLRHERTHKRLSAQTQALRQTVLGRLPNELMNPLGGVVAFSQLLLEEKLPPKARELVLDIHESGRRLERLFKKYLLFTQLEFARLSGESGAAEGAETTPGASELVKAQAAKVAAAHLREADLFFDVDKMALRISERTLERIVWELVENACLYSPAGAPIKVSLKFSANVARLAVKDEGPGFTEEELLAIGPFVRFERPVEGERGLGLGLYILQRLAREENGEFHIEPQPKGTLCVFEMAG